jgi:N-acetylglucosamine-6-phosphate deacetylase
MKERAVIAWHYQTREPVEVRFLDGVITSVQATASPPSGQTSIAPGLVDLQVNGFGGIDFQQDQLTAQHLTTAVRRLRAAGCTRFLLTLITDEWNRLLGRLRHIRALRAKIDRGFSPSLIATVRGAGYMLEEPESVA